MVKTHEIDLNASKFNEFNEQDYIIIEDKENKIEKGDYILFKQTGNTEDMGTEYTGLFSMIQVKEVINDNGLKDNFKLLLLNKM